MSESTPQPFAYVMIVEPDDTTRDFILRTFEEPNCAIDVACDEDEAVRKALQHRPQLIIVKHHEELDLDSSQPSQLPTVSIASRICRRARLRRSVRLVTHTDGGINFHLQYRQRGLQAVWLRKYTEPYKCGLLRPLFKTQLWRKEWFAYCTHDQALKFLYDHLPFWLGRTQ